MTPQTNVTTDQLAEYVEKNPEAFEWMDECDTLKVFYCGYFGIKMLEEAVSDATPGEWFFLRELSDHEARCLIKDALEKRLDEAGYHISRSPTTEGCVETTVARISGKDIEIISEHPDPLTAMYLACMKIGEADAK